MPEPGQLILGVDGALHLADALAERKDQVAEVSERGVLRPALVTARSVVPVHRVEASQRHGERVLGDGQPRRELLDGGHGVGSRSSHPETWPGLALRSSATTHILANLPLTGLVTGPALST